MRLRSSLELGEAKLLVLANKQDDEAALSVDEAREALGLDRQEYDVSAAVGSAPPAEGEATFVGGCVARGEDDGGVCAALDWPSERLGSHSESQPAPRWPQV